MKLSYRFPYLPFSVMSILTLIHGSFLGVHALKIYTTFKHLFYHRNSKGATNSHGGALSEAHRNTKSLTPFQIWENGNQAVNYFKFIDETTNEVTQQEMDYSARLEITVNYQKAIQREDEIIEAVNDAYQAAGSVSTESICTLISNRARGIRLAADNFYCLNYFILLPTTFLPPLLLYIP
ncbi:hypothetical protein BCR42DRAFT_397927 [Absidia repens]|uniref:Uncharacterized protein n=1 Tax=Absidia repens TaxID=90262 RepID=A0A1X2HZX8_9FUNG|nr:hypothetical protein BCR42DRAFT_397927 [Absidia repens]